MPALRPRYEALARRRVGALNESQAASYRAVGFKSRGLATHTNASRLLRTDRMRQRIAELQEQAAKRHERTIDTIGRQLDEAHEMALRLGQPGAAVAASMALARLYGLIANRSESRAASGFEACKTPADVIDMMIEEAGTIEAALSGLDAMRDKLMKRMEDRSIDQPSIAYCSTA